MSVAACAEIVQRGDPDRFLSAMAGPVAARSVLFPIYALNVEVARAPWVTAEPMIAEMRLTWWREALAEIKTRVPVRPHEVTTPLAAVLDAGSADLLIALIEARRWDIYTDPFADEAALAAYLDATAGGLTWAAARALGASDGEALCRGVAWAGGLAAWFLAVPMLEARGRCPLPDRREAAIAALAERGRALLRQKPPKAAAPALLWTWRASALLTQAQHAPGRVLDGTLRQSEFMRRASLIQAALWPA